METENLYNVYVRLDNRLDREFTVTATYSEMVALESVLRNREHVIEVNFGLEHADWRPFDVIEEVSSWIDGEY